MAAADLPGWDGFLGTRASFMMDAVVVAMAAVLPCLFWSVQQARRGRFAVHRRVQLALAVTLLAAVAAFEIDVRVNGWQERAAESGSPSPLVWTALSVHLVFAISTAILWPIVVVRAVRRFPNPPLPGDHGASHRRWGRIAAWDMTATAVTGWIFYWLAFVW